MTFSELEQKFKRAGLELTKKGKTFRSGGNTLASLSEAEKWLEQVTKLVPGVYPIEHISAREAAGKTTLELILPSFVGSPVEDPDRVYGEQEIIERAIAIDAGAIDVQTALEVLALSGEGYANNGNGWVRIVYK